MRRWLKSMDAFDRWAMISVAVSAAYLGWQFWIRKP